MKRALVATLLCALWAAPGADARARKKRPTKAARGEDPSRWFATRAGLIRVYEVKSRSDDTSGEHAGASCEVVESVPAAEGSAARTRESCTMIVGRKPKLATQLTYELRPSGIFMVKAEQAGAKKPPAALERLLLPGPLRVGSSWREPRGPLVLDRRVKAAGSPCKAAGFSFGDCLVVAVVQRKGGKVARRFTETYAAGVGLVEDAQWHLVDLKGL